MSITHKESKTGVIEVVRNLRNIEPRKKPTSHRRDISYLSDLTPTDSSPIFTAEKIS